MGTIIARGGGFDSDSAQIWALMRYTVSFTGKDRPNFLLVPTTQFDVINPGTLNAYHKLGCEVDTLLLTSDATTPDIIKRKIAAADVIAVPGGNARFTRELWAKTGADGYIVEAYERGAVLTGTSAGAMIWFEYAYDNCGPDDSIVFTPGLGLIPYSMCPHYGGEVWGTFDSRVAEAGISGVAVENGAAYCVLPDGGVSIYTATGTEKAYFFDKDKNYLKTPLN